MKDKNYVSNVMSDKLELVSVRQFEFHFRPQGFHSRHRPMSAVNF